MLSTSYFWNLSKAIYRPRNFREQKRAFSFFCISIMHKDLFREFYDYFDSYEPMKGFFTEKDIDFQERSCIVTGKGNKQREVYFDARTKFIS